jgi:C-5 cytosine-specific DNA methylase
MVFSRLQVPSHRACSPGQVLPEMPAPSHASPGHPFLPSHVSLETAFSNIAADDRLHKKTSYRYPRVSDLSPTEPFHGTVTTSLDIPYWDETRPLTKRELARIQSFPDSHIFGDIHVAKQSKDSLFEAKLTCSWKRGATIIGETGISECCSRVEEDGWA